MKNLSKEHKAAAKSIISAGLVKAAESLSFFMQEQITIDNTDEDCLGCDPLDLARKDQENIHVLVTKVIGEIGGVCCLIFSEEEAELLRTIALPEEIRSNEAMMAEMADGILLEVDNIISASVISQFSNLLKVRIFGDVPQLFKMNYTEMIDYLKAEISNELYLVSFKTNFHSSKVQFKPEFLWLFNETFMEHVINSTQSIEN